MTEELKRLQEECWLMDKRVKELEEQRITKDVYRRRIKTAKERIRKLEDE